jgi:hypothetical protein
MINLIFSYLNSKVREFQLFFITLTYKYLVNTSFLFYIKNIIIICFIDGLISDDEPIFEPIEWTLAESWLMFILLFGWIVENLIRARYWGYTGRDKRVWIGWYKTYWLCQFWYMVSFFFTSLYVITPYYFEITYNISYIHSWWYWWTSSFFFTFTLLYTILMVFMFIFQVLTRYIYWKKLFYLSLLPNLLIGYLLYTQFIIIFFGFFTDPLWYQKTSLVNYIQLSHEPLRWGWGPKAKDHFTYHSTKTVFWYKNDGPFASAFLIQNILIFASTFFYLFMTITLSRRIYSTKEVPHTLLSYIVSGLRQYFYFYLFMYFFILLSFLIEYLRIPFDLNHTYNNYILYLDIYYFLSDLFFSLLN